MLRGCREWVSGGSASDGHSSWNYSSKFCRAREPYFGGRGQATSGQELSHGSVILTLAKTTAVKDCKGEPQSGTRRYCCYCSILQPRAYAEPILHLQSAGWV